MPCKNNSLDSTSNGASSGWKCRRGHLGHCGHGNDEPIGPWEFCAAGDGLPLWTLAVITMMEGQVQCQAMYIQVRRGRARLWVSVALGAFAFPVPSSSSRRGLDNPVSSSLVGRDTSWGMLLVESCSVESRGGSGSMVSQKEGQYSPDGSLRKLWILGSLDTGLLVHFGHCEAFRACSKQTKSTVAN